MEKLNSAPYRFHLINNLLNSEVYLINYIITNGQWDFTEIGPLIEKTKDGNYRLTVAGKNAQIEATLFVGPYDSIIADGYTEFFPKQGGLQIPFKKGFAYFSSDGKKLVGIVKYRDPFVEDNYWFFPLNESLN